MKTQCLLRGTVNSINAVALCFRRLDADLSPHRPGFDPGTLYVKFVVNKVALGENFSEYCDSSLLV